MEENRRPIKTRSASWALKSTDFLVRKDISPNQVSVASIGFALIGSVALGLSSGAIASAICIIGILLRLICNLLDGMVAIEGGKKSPVGSLYNEFPDRIADSLLIVALGYAAEHPTLGWLGALAAALTAYVRVFGGSLGLAQSFRGPMAKQHRMAVMSGGLVINIVETIYSQTHYSLLATLGLITAGSLLTCWTRTSDIAKSLREAQ